MGRCEICGETAENISSWGGGGKEFMQRWHETSGMDGQGSSKAFCMSHSFCNLLIACFIIVFVLPWFLHIHMVLHDLGRKKVVEHVQLGK
ncbi:hypothetical protein E2562_010262 [Oryza meyeriana var. granulata]|uniref:Uncharacterized protein n=1 Tax=Oryza meyeriana var. granulata TaxID=110450 RepID=A0A6G1EIL0_9ORYZ|nr:hypothetical protein E2562_010262 [Oryza meyeriana var. granulata]